MPPGAGRRRRQGAADTRAGEGPAASSPADVVVLAARRHALESLTLHFTACGLSPAEASPSGLRAYLEALADTPDARESRVLTALAQCATLSHSGDAGELPVPRDATWPLRSAFQDLYKSAPVEAALYYAVTCLVEEHGILDALPCVAASERAGVSTLALAALQALIGQGWHSNGDLSIPAVKAAITRRAVLEPIVQAMHLSAQQRTPEWLRRVAQLVTTVARASNALICADEALPVNALVRALAGLGTSGPGSQDLQLAAYDPELRLLLLLAA